jgi:predicted metal-dependent phosphoesterase TrpH
MKKGILFFTVLFFTSTVYAQNTDYFNKLAAEAKTLIERKSFIGAQTKIGQLEKEVNKIKTATPSFNPTDLEAEIKNLKDNLTAAREKREVEKNANQDGTINAVKIKKLLDDVFIFIW